MTGNKPFAEMTLGELWAEYDLWNGKIANAPAWGASVAAAAEFRDGCAAWIKRRESEAEHTDDPEVAPQVRSPS